MQTIKTILNNVLAQSAFLEVASFFNSSDPDKKQMVALSNRVGIEIMDFADWPSQRRSFNFTSNPGQKLYSLPTDFRSLVPDSAWELDGTRKMQFPVPDNAWFMYKYSAYSAGGLARVKMTSNNQIEVINDDQSDSFAFDYISDAYAKDASGAVKSEFTLDTDTWLLDDQLLTLGIQAHWQQAKGIPTYKENYSNYMNKMREAFGRANGGITIGGRGTQGIGRGAPYYPLYRPAS